MIHPPAPTGSFATRHADPLRFCVMSTVAVLTWAIGPAVVIVMSVLGLLAYRRAIRAGLTSTRCVLRRPNLVLAYLTLLLIAGVAGLAGGW